MKSYLFTISLCLTLLMGCRHTPFPSAFSEAERMMYVAPDSAFLCLDALPHAQYSEAVAARYALLLTRAADKSGHSLLPYDSLLNIALCHYPAQSEYRAWALLYKACLESEINHSDEAIRHLQEGLTILELHPEERETKRISLGLLGDLYYQHKHYDESLELQRTMLSYCTSLRDSAMTYKDIGSAFAMMGKQDSAFYYNRLALSCAQEEGDSSLIANYQHSMALTHHLFGNPDSALHYAQLALASAPTSEPKGRFHYTLGSLLDELDGSPDSIQSHMEQASTDTTYEGSFLTSLILSDLAEQKGDYPTAIDHLYDYIDHLDSLYTAERSVDVQQLIYEYDTKLQLQKAEAQARERRIQIIGAALLVIGLLSICYLIYYDKKKRQTLQAQQQLAQAEAKISTLKMALTDRNKALEELRLNTLHMARVRFAQTEIYQKVVQLAQKEEGEQVLPVLSHTDRGKLSQEVFNLFSDYIREQQEENPTLTDNDLLYLCLQESNLSNRAIAIGMGYSDLSGVRQIKKRVKDKLKLSPSPFTKA